MGRPTSFFYATPKGCGSTSCSQEVLALGTPFLWWSGVVAIAVTFGYWIARREWQSGLLLLAIAAGYLPWFTFQKRTMFSFYAIAFEPFMILVIAYLISNFLETDRHVKRRKQLVMAYICAIVLCFIYFSPLYFGGVLTYSDWIHRMWFPSWI